MHKKHMIRNILIQSPILRLYVIGLSVGGRERRFFPWLVVLASRVLIGGIGGRCHWNIFPAYHPQQLVHVIVDDRGDVEG